MLRNFENIAVKL